MGLLLGCLGLAYLLSLAELKQHPLPLLGQVSGFTLTNQDGNITTLAGLTNHVWVADIIFHPVRRAMSAHDRADGIVAGSAAGEK